MADKSGLLQKTHKLLEIFFPKKPEQPRPDGVFTLGDQILHLHWRTVTAKLTHVELSILNTVLGKLDIKHVD